MLLVDADLRRPWVHEMFQIPNVSGLNDGLRSEDDRKIPLLRLTDHLTVLTAGRPDRDPMSVLSSTRMRRVLQEAARRFEWVIIDTPPVALLTDAHLLSSLVDAVILVIESRQDAAGGDQQGGEAVGPGADSRRGAQPGRSAPLLSRLTTTTGRTDEPRRPRSVQLRNA